MFEANDRKCAKSKKTYKDFKEGAKVLQPHFEGVVRSPLTLPKMGLESPSGLPKTQSVIAGVKTPHIEAFFIPFFIPFERS